MSDRRDQIRRVRSIHGKIRDILLDDWDPIGVKDIPEAQHEYDSYIGQIYREIADHSGSYPIVQLLARVESEQMGLGERPPMTLEPVAQKLATLADEPR
jgi:hypothetical protein